MVCETKIILFLDLGSPMTEISIQCISAGDFVLLYSLTSGSYFGQVNSVNIATFYTPTKTFEKKCSCEDFTNIVMRHLCIKTEM